MPPLLSFFCYKIKENPQDQTNLEKKILVELVRNKYEFVNQIAQEHQIKRFAFSLNQLIIWLSETEKGVLKENTRLVNIIKGLPMSTKVQTNTQTQNRKHTKRVKWWTFNLL